jgi:hypothetical protein
MILGSMLHSQASKTLQKKNYNKKEKIEEAQNSAETQQNTLQRCLIFN